MTVTATEPATSGPRVLAIVPIVMAVSWLDDALVGGMRFVADPSWSIVASGVAAGVVGVPFGFWAASRPRRSLASFLALGAAGALAVAAVLVATGFIGQMLNSHAAHNRLVRGVHSAFGYAVWTLRQGASVPLNGVVPWPAFLAWTAHVVAVGLVSAAAYWWIAGRPRAG